MTSTVRTVVEVPGAAPPRDAEHNKEEERKGVVSHPPQQPLPRHGRLAARPHPPRGRRRQQRRPQCHAAVPLARRSCGGTYCCCCHRRGPAALHPRRHRHRARPNVSLVERQGPWGRPPAARRRGCCGRGLGKGGRARPGPRRALWSRGGMWGRGRDGLGRFRECADEQTNERENARTRDM